MKRVAAIQMNSGTDVAENLTTAGRLLQKAADGGAKLAVLPEMFAIMGTDQFDKIQVCETEGQGEIQDFLAATAAKLGMWIVSGTIPLVASTDDKIRAACLIYNEKGEQVGRYDKVHLFDAVVVEGKETYRESLCTEPGEGVVVIDTPVGRLGIGVCYDLRFPELFRLLFQRGAQIIALPAAFAKTTGRLHWELLLRARAVENQCYTIGATQDGEHASGRKTFGSSMIIDPWGEILSHLPHGEGVIISEIDLDYLAELRKNFPIADHQCIYYDPESFSGDE